MTTRSAIPPIVIFLHLNGYIVIMSRNSTVPLALTILLYMNIKTTIGTV
jgi:hypothetical protein